MIAAAHPRGRHLSAAVLLDAAMPLALTAAAIAMWLVSLPRIEVSGVSDLGLISVLPAQFFLSLVLLTASFCLCLRDLPHRKLIALINVGLLILIVFGTTAIVEPEPRIAASWRHAGVIESISRNGAVDPSIDAYFNWPGFFILGSFLTDVAGVGSAIAFLMWAPVFFNLLYLPPLLMLFRSVTDDDRVVWLAVWIFFAANWIAQDYFSPQALNYFLFLVVIAVVIRWFGRDGGPAFGRDPAATAAPGERSIGKLERTALLAIVIAVLGTIVASHQLTPFAVLVALSALVAVRRCETTRLPILMAVLIGSWSAFLAVAYFKGHLETLTGHVGALEQNVDSSVSGRIRGSPEHLLVLQARLALTGALWGLGFLGAVRAFRRRQFPVTFAVLAMAPFVLMAMQPYGGEMLLRAYLFSLPFTAFFVAKLFYPRRDFGGSWLTTAAVGVVVGTLVLGLFVTRYGNERMDFFSKQEVAAVRHVMQTAEPGSLLVAAAPSVPWKFARYEEFKYELLEHSALWAQVDPSNPKLRVLVNGLEQTLKHPKGGKSFFILTRSQEAQLELTGWPPGFFSRFRDALTSSPKFELAYRNPDAAVFVLTQKPTRPARGDTPELRTLALRAAEGSSSGGPLKAFGPGGVWALLVLFVGVIGHVIGLVLGVRARRAPADERPSGPSAARSHQLRPVAAGHLPSRRGPTVTLEGHAVSAARGALSPWPLTAVVATTAVVLVAFGAIGSPVAPIVALGFLLVFPGMALVRLLAIDDFATELSLSIATSIALATILSTTSLYVGHASTAAVLGVLVAVTLGGTTVELLRTRPVPSRRDIQLAEHVRLNLDPLEPPRIPDRDRHPEGERGGRGFRPLGQAVRRFAARRPAVGASEGLLRTLAVTNLTIAVGLFVLLMRGLV